MWNENRMDEYGGKGEENMGEGQKDPGQSDDPHETISYSEL